MQALYWLGELTNDAAACLGDRPALFQSFPNNHSISLPDAISWRPVLQGWPRITRQHDVGEFAQYFIERINSQIGTGRWEARIAEPFTIVDSGPLSGPVLLHLGDDRLQAMINRWHTRYAVHALVLHAGIVLLQLCRYGGAENPRKNQSPLAIRPGEKVQLPVFTSDAELSIRHESFIVGFIVIHTGDRVTSGHYRTVLCVPKPERPGPSWESWVCDDSRPPKKCTSKDDAIIRKNSYLVGLVRAPRPPEDSHASGVRH